MLQNIHIIWNTLYIIIFQSEIVLQQLAALRRPPQEEQTDLNLPFFLSVIALLLGLVIVLSNLSESRVWQGSKILICTSYIVPVEDWPADQVWREPAGAGGADQPAAEGPLPHPAHRRQPRLHGGGDTAGQHGEGGHLQGDGSNLQRNIQQENNNFSKRSRWWISVESSRLLISCCHVPCSLSLHAIQINIYLYELSPRETTSRVSTCHFFGSLLKSLLSFYHVQSGWNFNMLESELAAVNWPEELTIYGPGPDLWPLKFWPWILSIDPVGKIYGQNLSDHKYGPEL